MKKLQLLAFAASLTLAATLSAESKPKITFGKPLPPSGGAVTQACVPVYCDGELAGIICGTTTQQLVDRAEAVCGV